VPASHYIINPTTTRPPPTASCADRRLSTQRFQGRYGVRMGRDFRVVYTVFKKERVVDIEFVGDRKDAYRWL